MFLFHPIHFLKFLLKSQPQRSCKKGSYIYIRVYSKGTQPQAASTQNVPRVDDSQVHNIALTSSDFNKFFSITFFPDEEFFLKLF